MRGLITEAKRLHHKMSVKYEGEGKGGENKLNNYKKTDDNQSPTPLSPSPTRGDSFPQESIFPALAAKTGQIRLYTCLFTYRELPPRGIIKYTPELIL